MPAKSEAQRRWSYAAEKRGEISHKVAEEFHKGAPGKKLPQHVKDSKTYRGHERHGNRK